MKPARGSRFAKVCSAPAAAGFPWATGARLKATKIRQRQRQRVRDAEDDHIASLNVRKRSVGSKSRPLTDTEIIHYWFGCSLRGYRSGDPIVMQGQARIAREWLKRVVGKKAA